MYKVKNLVAIILDFLCLSSIFLRCFNKKFPAYIRVLNYHSVPSECEADFSRQIDYYQKHFDFISSMELKEYLNHRKTINKPSILMTFDDGFKDNYTVAAKILDQKGIKGLFFVSSDRIGEEGYMSLKDIQELIDNGHSIGGHTASHHRMSEVDSTQKLEYEIVESRIKLERLTKETIDSFCWVGGETSTYCSKSEKIIRDSYKYSFLTNNEIVTKNTDKYRIQRTNIEAYDSKHMVKLQISGLIDLLYSRKRKLVNKELDKYDRNTI